MPEIRDWTEMKVMSARLLKERTGEDLETWNQRIRRESFADEKALRAWLGPNPAPDLRWRSEALVT